MLMFGEHRFIKHEFPHYLLDYREETGDNERWADRLVSFSGDWTGNLYDFYFRAYNKMKAALKVPFQLEGIDRVDDTPAHRALREAIANCLTNANYFERRGVVCVWREDAFEIANPGVFRMPIEEAMKPGSSDPRNETLLSIFALVNVGERAGSGMDKITSGWAWAGYSEPTYEAKYDPDRTVLTMPLVKASAEKVSDGKNRQIKSADSETGGQTTKSVRSKAAILAFLEDGSLAKSADIAQGVGLGTSRTNELLRELIEAGAVVAEGAARSRAYRLSSK